MRAGIHYHISCDTPKKPNASMPSSGQHWERNEADAIKVFNLMTTLFKDVFLFKKTVVKKEIASCETIKKHIED